MSLAARILGSVWRPRATMTAVLRRPDWAGALLITTVLPVLAAAALFGTEVGRQALVDQWERTAIAFGQPVDDTRYAGLQEASAQGPWYGAGMAVLGGPVLTLAVAAGVWLAFRRSGPAVTFRQVLAVATHAGVILALRQLVGAPLTYLRETTASATSLGVWFPMLDEAAPVARFLGILDIFVLWWCVVLAIGVSVAYGRRARTLAPAAIGLYAGAAALLALVMAVTGGTA